MVTGHTTSFDIAALLIWSGLVLAPLFGEVKLFGLQFKSEVEKLRSEVRGDLASIRADISSILDVRNTVSQTVTIPAPAPDTQLDALEERVARVIDVALSSRGLRATTETVALSVPDDVSQLFNARYNVEKELRRIAQVRGLPQALETGRLITQVTIILAEVGLISRDIGSAIRELYLITSRAIHGQDVTASQVAFVRDMTPRLIQILRDLA